MVKRRNRFQAWGQTKEHRYDLRLRGWEWNPGARCWDLFDVEEDSPGVEFAKNLAGVSVTFGRPFDTRRD